MGFKKHQMGLKSTKAILFGPITNSIVLSRYPFFLKVWEILFYEVYTHEKQN